MSNNTNSTAVPSFASVAELQSELAKKMLFQPADLYPRDGNREIAKIEARIAKLAGFKASEVILCNTGMAAVTGAIGTCIQAGATFACGEQCYPQTAIYFNQILPRLGIKIVKFDSGSLESINQVVKKYLPDVIFTETVANGPDSPVLDVAGLFKLKSIQRLNPYIILDNTLPLSTGMPLDKVFAGRQKVLGVESATKSYVFNKEMCGIIYSKDSELLQTLRQQRRTVGFFPNVVALARISKLLPTSAADFHARNKTVFQNTAELARICARTTRQIGNFSVSHPLLPNHPNRNLAAQYHNNLTPVFFLQSTSREDLFSLTERLWCHPHVRKYCDLGQSFAFDRTRIMPIPDEIRPAVRIAIGAHTDVQALGNALSEALLGERKITKAKLHLVGC